MSIPSKVTYCCIGLIFSLATIAGFYRNRDPYKAYFYSRPDTYLTTHLTESGFDDNCLELELRLSRKYTPNFYKAIQHMYHGKRVALTTTGYFNSHKIEEVTGITTSTQQNLLQLPSDTVPTLLQEGSYSFYYSPLIYSSLDQDHFISTIDNGKNKCAQFVPPWDKTGFPYLSVLLPIKEEQDTTILIARSGNYLFFIPSSNPVLSDIK